MPAGPGCAMPTAGCAKTIRTAISKCPAFLCRAVAQSDRVPYGMGIEETIRELWLGK